MIQENSEQSSDFGTFNDFEIDDSLFEVNESFAEDDYFSPSETVQQNTLAEFVASKLNIEDGNFVTGSVDNPVEKNINELNEKQLTALLDTYYKDKYSSAFRDMDLDDSEVQVLNMLRKGDLKTLHNELSKELGIDDTPSVQGMPENWEADDFLMWKISQDYPNLSEAEIMEELEEAKLSPSYDSKVATARRQLEEALELQQQYQQAELQQQINSKRDELIQKARNLDNLFGFELDDDVKNQALNDIFQFDGTNYNRFVRNYVEDPDGLLHASLAVAALPKISEYVKGLHERIERLESGRGRVNRPKTSRQSFDPSSTFDAEDVFSDLQPTI